MNNKKRYLKSETYFCCFLAYLKEKGENTILKENCLNAIEGTKNNPKFQNCLEDFQNTLEDKEVLDDVFQVLENAKYIEKEEENYKIIMEDHVKNLILNQMKRENYNIFMQTLKSFYEFYQNPLNELKVSKEEISTPTITSKVSPPELNEKNLSNVSDFILALSSNLCKEEETSVLDEDIFSQTIDALYNNGVYNIRLDGSLIPFLENYFERTFTTISDESINEVFNRLTQINVLERDPNGNFRFKIHISPEQSEHILQFISQTDLNKLEKFTKQYLEIYHNLIQKR